MEYEAAPAACIVGVAESVAVAVRPSPAVGEYDRTAGFSIRARCAELTGARLFTFISLIKINIYTKASAAYARRPIILDVFIGSGILPAEGNDCAAAYRYIAAATARASADARAANGAD